MSHLFFKSAAMTRGIAVRLTALRVARAFCPWVCAFPLFAADAPQWAKITVPPGFEVIPVAGAPLVSFPMMGGFDDRGRLFIAENAGVNLDEKALAEQKPSRIRVLEDTDGDGVFDKSTIFAEGLTFPQGAQWFDGALYVASPPSIWRFEDTDGDGKADTRREIATGFKFTGNAADVHGPFLHPNGRLYWCHGRKGHEVYQNGGPFDGLRAGGALVSKALGARIWSCRPDGTDIQVHAGGGMDNPTEVTFNQEGEVFGVANIFQSGPRADAVLHWIYGGVFPRVDQEPVLAEFKRTGDLLPPITLLGHVAPAGLTLRRSDTWGAEYQNNLFLSEFNTHRIMRLPLERNGATYRGRAEVFASTEDPGVHFTDVIEDADGSLLIIDTGAWFRRGCPSSVVARADVLGAIYRIRKTGARRVNDPCGIQIAWGTPDVSKLTALLGDARTAVRDHAVTELAKRGDAATPALRTALENSSALVRSNALWALTRIATPAAQAAARRGLRDLDRNVRQVACQSAFITADREAVELLVALLVDDAPAVQAEAARALGRLHDARAIPALGGAVALPHDPFLTHALTLAMIEIDAPAETRRLLGSREWRAWRAALIALDQGAQASVTPAEVFSALKTNNADLQAAALQIAVRHRDWGKAAANYLASARPVPADVAARLIPAFIDAPEIHAWLKTEFQAGASSLNPVVLLDAIAGAPQAWDESWRDYLATSLRSSELPRAQAALRAIGAHRKRDFSALLRDVGRDAQRPTALRVAALQLAAGSDNTLDADSFNMLVEPLVRGGLPDARLHAANVLGGAKLTRPQTLQLIAALPALGPVELQQVLGAFTRGPADGEVASKLLASLQQSPGRWGVQETTLQTIFQRYPGAAYENAAPMIREIMGQNLAKDGRVAELEVIAADGDAARGQTAFTNGVGACIGCHRVGATGGVVGPDLSHIGRIRTTRDLLESISFPSATIARGYETFQVSTKDGKSLLGTLPRETADTVFVVTPDGRENPVARADIAKVDPVPTSLMPPGLDRTMEPKMLADIVAFLKAQQ